MDELRQRFPFSFLDLELAFFQAALRAHKGLLSQAKQKALENFVADLEPMAECVCDYRVRLQAMGVDVTALRAMGAAESQMARFGDRTKHHHQSWSRHGLHAIMESICAEMEGRLEEVAQACQQVLVSKIPEVAETVQRASQRVVQAVTSRLGEIHWTHLPITDAGLTRSGGLSKFFRQLADNTGY